MNPLSRRITLSYTTEPLLFFLGFLSPFDFPFFFSRVRVRPGIFLNIYNFSLTPERRDFLNVPLSQIANRDMKLQTIAAESILGLVFEGALTNAYLFKY
jgi:hypothetical protein